MLLLSLYFGRKYDCLGLANINWMSAIKLKFALQMGKSKNLGFSNFEGNNKITRFCYGLPCKFILYYM